MKNVRSDIIILLTKVEVILRGISRERIDRGTYLIYNITKAHRSFLFLNNFGAFLLLGKQADMAESGAENE